MPASYRETSPDDLDRRIQKVYVESFGNKTAQAGLENYFRTAFINQLIQNSRFKSVESVEAADAIIRSAVVGDDQVPVTTGLGHNAFYGFVEIRFPTIKRDGDG